MTVIDAILETLHETQPDPTEPATPYLAGYCDAYAEIRARLERVLGSVDDTLYVLHKAPRGLVFLRLSLRALEVDSPAPAVPPPNRDPQPPPPDQPF